MVVNKQQSVVSLDARNIYGKHPAEFGDAVEIIFPDDPAIVINVQDFGAIGDGVADDTQAIQNAIYAADESNRALYFSNGIYRVTKEIRFETSDGGPLFTGPHLYGQSRDGVILKLDDYAAGFNNPKNPYQAVIRAINAPDGTTFENVSADFFNRYMVNFTIDTGNNPGAVGIKFHSNNTGTLRNVRIVGDGAIGLDLNAVDLNGPHLVQNLEVEGFDVGVRAAGANSSTLSNITIKDAGSYGLYHTSKDLQVEGLTVENAPVAVFTSPGTATLRTTLTLVNGNFTGSDSTKSAVVSGDVLFARNITTDGYAQAIQANAGSTGDVVGKTVDEYSSHGVSKTFDSNVSRSLNLPIQYQPLTYDPDLANWISVADYGALPGDNIDDTNAIQAAIDAAAANGQTTLYFPGNSSIEPNWYTLDGTVSVHGSINHFLGFAPARILGEGKFSLVEDADAAKVVQFQGFNFTRIGYENASSRTMMLDTLTGDVFATGPGDVFINSFAGRLQMNHPDANVWARQLNTEKADGLNIINDGGTLLLLGHKTEKGSVKAQTINGGYTEIIGAYIFSLGEGDFDTVYEVIDSNASFAGVRERTNTAKYANFFREIRTGDSRIFTEADMPVDNAFNRAASLYSASTLSFPDTALGISQTTEPKAPFASPKNVLADRLSSGLDW